jgi:hypothetical protein
LLATTDAYQEFSRFNHTLPALVDQRHVAVQW